MVQNEIKIGDILPLLGSWQYYYLAPMEHFTKKTRIYRRFHRKHNRIIEMTQLKSYLDHTRRSIYVNADPLIYPILVGIAARANISLETRELLNC